MARSSQLGIRQLPLRISPWSCLAGYALAVFTLQPDEGSAARVGTCVENIRGLVPASTLLRLIRTKGKRLPKPLGNSLSRCYFFANFTHQFSNS